MLERRLCYCCSIWWACNFLLHLAAISQNISSCEESASVTLYSSGGKLLGHGGTISALFHLWLDNCELVIFLKGNQSDSLVSLVQALPIFLDKLVPPWAAILISVTLILMFGEVFYKDWLCIIVYEILLEGFMQNIRSLKDLRVWIQILPQAVCTRYGLKVGAMMAPFVRVLLLLFFPVTYPISKVNPILTAIMGIRVLMLVTLSFVVIPVLSC